MFSQLTSTLNADKWVSGNMEINSSTIKFPTLTLSMANVSFVGWFKISWRQYIWSVCFLILFILHLSDALYQVTYFGILSAINPLLWCSGFGIVAWLLFPKHRCYVLINSNSGRTQMITAKTAKFAAAIKDAVVQYMENRDLKYPTKVNITTGDLSINTLHGDIVNRDKYTFNQA